MSKDFPEPRSRPTLAGVVTSCHDEYLSSFRAFRLGGFILGRATRKWSLKRCSLSSCVLEYGVDAAPWAASGSTVEGVATFAFAGSPDARLSADGRDLSQAVCFWPAGARVSMVAHRPADLFVLSVGERDLAAANASGPSQPVAAGASFLVEPERVGRIRALALRVLEESEAARPAGLSPERSTSLERALLGELVCLATDPLSTRRGGVPRIDRRPVLEKVEKLLEAQSSEPVYVADLCEATGLAERTLRFILVEQYGTSPIRLLRCRRLCQLRRSLRAEGNGTENLSRIAARHGFRHMGMLASDYWNLFGELPSETRRTTGEIVTGAFGRTAARTLPDGIGLASTPAVGAVAGSAGR